MVHQGEPVIDQGAIFKHCFFAILEGAIYVVNCV